MKRFNAIFTPFIKFFTALIFISGIFSLNVIAEEKKIYKIASGSILEPYYFIGIKICNIIEKQNKGVVCQIIPTNGTLESLTLLENKEVDFAFVASNIALDVFNGSLNFKNTKSNQNLPKNMKNLRQIMRLHDEIFTVIAKDDDHILVFGDIDGKKISNGPPSSDSEVTYDSLVQLYNFEQMPIDIDLLHEEYAKEFCEKRIDAILMMASHPNALVSNIASRCNVEFVPLEPKKIDEFISKHPNFKKAKLDIGIYPDIDHEQYTLGVSSMFVSRDDVDRDVVSSLMNYIRNNIKEFKLAHQVLNNLSDDHFEKGFDLPGL